MSKMKTSKYNGVTGQEGAWEAYYHKNGDKVYIGHFFDEEMAARAVDATIGRPLNFQDFLTIEEILAQDASRRREVKGYRGTYFHPRLNKWEAAIKSDGKRISIGYFSSQELAARAYDQQAKLLRGKKAKLNFPEGL